MNAVALFLLDYPEDLHLEGVAKTIDMIISYSCPS